MHPAYSVIFFTTASGAGYGLVFWICLLVLAGAFPAESWLAVTALTLGLALAAAGLLSSLLHLGHPERAHRALSQWRSSWLSREGVAAIASFVPAGLSWLLWLTGLGGGAVPVLAVLTAAGAVVTVYCTGMIYASLRTIRHWNRPDVPALYFALASATGLLLLALLVAAFRGAVPPYLGALTLANLAVAAALKWRYWKSVDADPGHYTREMALGNLGRARPLDPPHTQPNFVMREMGYAVARKHAARLRRWVWLSLFAVPAGLALVALVASSAAAGLLGLAAIAATVGVATERWLFFAEAEHVSMLYYGTTQA